MIKELRLRFYFGVVLFLLLIPNLLNAQYRRGRLGEAFYEGFNYTSAMLSANNRYSEEVGGSVVPPFIISTEYAFNLDMGAGGAGGYSVNNNKRYNNTKIENQYSFYYLEARYYYHLNNKVITLDHFDYYMFGGIGSIWQKWVIGTGPNTRSESTNEVYFTLMAGARYFIVENFGITAEAGWGVSNLNMGIVLRY